ncbi:MAG: DUF21 domain-containing protein [Proteobacteria bacterium]|nr:DUF21 domain-containing protein [Pseudomonadota bacterium]
METELIIILAAIILILIIISAFFSGSETALMSSSKPKLFSLKAENKKAQDVMNILDKPRELISTILLGNNLVNIAASALATVLFTNLFGNVGVFYATLFMTCLVLIFAEVLPKTIASLYPEKIAMMIIKVMMIISFALKPFTIAINFITNRLINAIGVKSEHEQSPFDEDDIKGAINLGLKTGVLERGEHQMLDSIVELDSINAEEVMQHRLNIESLDTTLNIDEIFEVVKKSSHSRIPVYKDDPDNIIGILYIKDFLPAYADSIKNQAEFKIETLLKDAVFVPETATVSSLLVEFKKTRSHMRFVVNEYGKLQGLITLEDILEEIVGEIDDEYDIVQKQFAKYKDGALVVSGAYSIRDCNRNFDWELPDENHITLGGFVTNLAENLPKVGDIFIYEHLQFQVLTKNKQSISKLKVYTKNKNNKDQQKI